MQWQLQQKGDLLRPRHSKSGAADSAASEKKNLEQLEEQDAAQSKASEAASGDKSSSETCGWSDVEAEQMKEMLEWAEVIEAEYRRSREFDAFSMKASSGGRPSFVSEPDSFGVMVGAVEDDPQGCRDQWCGSIARRAVARPEEIPFLWRLPLHVCDLLLRFVGNRPPGRFVPLGSPA